MRNLSREEYDKVTQEFAQLKTLSAQKKYVDEHKLDVQFCEPENKDTTEKTVDKEENKDGLQQDSK